MYKLFCNVLLQRNNFIGSFRLYTKYKEQCSFTTLRSGSRCESLRESARDTRKMKVSLNKLLSIDLYSCYADKMKLKRIFVPTKTEAVALWVCKGVAQYNVHCFLKLSRLEAEHLALNYSTLYTLCTVSNMYRFDF